MASRLKTTERTMDILKEIENKSNIRPNILARIAINLSIKNGHKPDQKEFDNKGLEFHHQTLFGNYKQLFKSMISQTIGRHISEEEFFPEITKNYLEDGIDLLKSEYEYAGNFDRFFINITNM